MGLGEDRKCLSQVVVALNLDGLCFLCDVVSHGFLFLNLSLLWLDYLGRLLLDLAHKTVCLYGHLLQLGLLLIQILTHLLYLLCSGQELLDSSLVAGSEAKGFLSFCP